MAMLSFGKNLSIKVTLALLCGVVTVGCVATMDHDVDLNSSPDGDRKYVSELSNSTRDKVVIKNFETRYELSVTYLSPEFREAFSERYKRLFNEGQPFLEEASSKAGFFVTIFAPVTEGYDLTDDQLWSIQLKNNAGSFKPSLVKRLYNKSRWQPFFKDVNYWSHEYLVLFDTPAVSTSAKLMEKNSVALNIANADARISLAW